MFGTYELISYPDKSSYVRVDEKETKYITDYYFQINSYSDLWILSQLVDAHTHVSGNPPTIWIPNLFDSQADRRFNFDQSSGLKLVCNFLNSLNAEYIILHPHNPEVVLALLNKVTVLDNSCFVEKVLEELSPIGLTLMSTDAGGYKSLLKLADTLHWKGDTLSASKSRTYDPFTGRTSITQLLPKEDFNGQDILLVDDLCVYGGTFKGLATLLRERNAGKLYLAVTHMTVPYPNPDLFSLFDCVYTTDSKYDSYFIPKGDGGSRPKNLVVISAQLLMKNSINQKRFVI